MGKRNIFGEIISTTSGVGILAVLFILDFPIFIAILSSFGTYLGMKLVQYRPSKDNKIQILNLEVPEDVKEEVEKCNTVIEAINKSRNNISNQNVVQKVNEIESKSKNIIEVLQQQERNYNKIKEVRRILSSVEELLEKYINISSHPIQFDKKTKTLNEFFKLLEEISDNLDNFYKKGIKGELLDMSIDIKVLRNKIQATTAEV